MRGVKDPGKQQYRYCNNGIENIFYILVDCTSRDAAKILLSWVKKLVPNTTLFDIIYLNVVLTLGSKEETAISILTALAVHNIWINREKGGINAWSLKTEAIAYTSMLMNTKYSSSAKVIHSLLL